MRNTMIFFQFVPKHSNKPGSMGLLNDHAGKIEEQFLCNFHVRKYNIGPHSTFKKLFYVYFYCFIYMSWQMCVCVEDCLIILSLNNSFLVVLKTSWYFIGGWRSDWIKKNSHLFFVLLNRIFLERCWVR